MMQVTVSWSQVIHWSLVKTMQTLCGPTACADRLGAVDQSQRNDDFGHSDQAKVTGRNPKEGNKVTHKIGEFHKLVPGLKRSLVQTGKIMSSKWKKNYDVALERQKAATRRRREIIFENKLEEAEEDYIVAVYFHEQYHSQHCWSTIVIAKETYKKLKSESARLVAVTEQILIRYLGLGWSEAHPPWSSKKKGTHSSKTLMKWLIDKVIPMADIMLVPDEPPVNIPSPLNMQALGTTSQLVEDLKTGNKDKQQNLRDGANKRRDKRKDRGEGDR